MCVCIKILRGIFVFRAQNTYEGISALKAVGREGRRAGPGRSRRDTNMGVNSGASLSPTHVKNRRGDTHNSRSFMFIFPFFYFFFIFCLSRNFVGVGGHRYERRGYGKSAKANPPISLLGSSACVGSVLIPANPRVAIKGFSVNISVTVLRSAGQRCHRSSTSR